MNLEIIDIFRPR